MVILGAPIFGSMLMRRVHMQNTMISWKCHLPVEIDTFGCVPQHDIVLSQDLAFGHVERFGPRPLELLKIVYTWQFFDPGRRDVFVRRLFAGVFGKMGGGHIIGAKPMPCYFGGHSRASGPFFNVGATLQRLVSNGIDVLLPSLG